MSRYEPVEYTNDGGFSVAGLPVLLLALLTAAVALGWLASTVGQWFYLILIFPLGIGFGMVAVGLAVNTFAKMRSLGLAALIGLAGGVAAMLAVYYFDYLRDGQPGQTFPAFMDEQAQKGVQISGRSGSGFNLGYTGTWIFWSVEVLIVAGLTAAGLVGGAVAPFCRDCQRWKQERTLGRLTGDGVGMVAVLKAGDPEELRHFDPQPNEGNVALNVHVCPGCEDASPIEVKLQTVPVQTDESASELVQLTFPGRALEEFEELFGARPRRRGKRRGDD